MAGKAVTRGWIHCLVGSFSLETDWDISPGQVLVLFGPSGSGKTSTLRAIAGLLRPQRGHIEIGGRPVYDSDSRLWVAPHLRKVGYLTQQYHLFPHLSVSANIAYGLPRKARSEDYARIPQLVQTFRLEGLEGRYPRELSGGQQQRVALARALAPDPEVLLLDEPFASLDAELRRTVRRELRVILSKTNIPVILVTHDREEALALGDVVQVIDRGRLLERGEPLKVLGQPGKGRVARLVGVENVLDMRVESLHPQDGTMVCISDRRENKSEGPLRLEVPLSDFKEGDAVTVGIRASDIILSRDRLLSSSARNQLPGDVNGIEMRPPGYQVDLDCNGTILHCHITGSSLAEMQIERYMQLWAVFKASSCFLVNAEGDQSAKQQL
jgi:molybdate transport system ATP-binding protein